MKTANSQRSGSRMREACNSGIVNSLAPLDGICHEATDGNNSVTHADSRE